ncbi:MAG: dienelactone hydrolase family protein [Gammaproteobacteria bacterium]|nr:dienelactone hydrolase family protein [Gammaproteobacteria bacterium]
MAQLIATDGFTLGAYDAMPKGEARGAVVVIQEIFGVNVHIREVCDGYAADGFAAIAPALFDRVQRGVELGYDQAAMGQGIELAMQKVDQGNALLDLQAAIDEAGRHGKVGVVGYCWGGLMAYLCACRLEGVSAAVGYYGGGIAGVASEAPTCPTMLHFGEKDAHISMSDVDKVRGARPEVEVNVYDADHGFNCDHRESYDEAASKLARERTLAFFSQHLGA